MKISWLITIRRPYIWNSFVIATDFPINLQFFLLFWTTIFGRLGKIPKVLKKLINDLDESGYPLFEMVLRWHNYLLQKNLGKGQFVAKKKACATKLLQTFIGTIASIPMCTYTFYNQFLDSENTPFVGKMSESELPSPVV